MFAVMSKSTFIISGEILSTPAAFTFHNSFNAFFISTTVISCSSGPLMYNFQYVRRPVHHGASSVQLYIKDTVDQDLSDTETHPFYF